MAGVTMERKSAMAFPSSPCAGPSPAAPQAPASSGHRLSPPGFNAAHGTSQRGWQGEHQLEKLEFALAVALTRGDLQRSAQLRDQIDALGGNREEPGT